MGNTNDTPSFNNFELESQSKLTPLKLNNLYEKQLIRQKVYGFAGTDGSFKSNFRAYLLTEHDLLSCIWTHKLDPFTRLKRCCFLYMTMCYILFVAQTTSGSTVSATAIFTSIIVEPIKFIIRRFIECDCARYDDVCLYRWLCCCFQSSSNSGSSGKESMLKEIDKYSWLLLILSCISGTVVAIGVIVSKCFIDDEESEGGCIDPISWLSSQLVSLLFTSTITIYFTCLIKFKTSKKWFQQMCEDEFEIYFDDNNDSCNPKSWSDIAYYIYCKGDWSGYSDEEKTEFIQYYNIDKGGGESGGSVISVTSGNICQFICGCSRSINTVNLEFGKKKVQPSDNSRQRQKTKLPLKTVTLPVPPVQWYEVTIPSHIKANEEFQVTVNNQVVVLMCPRGSSGGSMIRFQL